MDSVTQLALGAAVGHAVLGRQVGRRALVWGAVLGTVPDLDVFIPFGDPVSDFTWHRSWSHSLFVLSAITPLFGWLLQRCHPATREHRIGWHALVLLVFWTHVLLDCCTVYGTQILWPLPTTPVSWSTIFVIDPLYTLPLLAGVVLAAFRRPRWSVVGLVFSTLYLLWSVVAKFEVERAVANELDRRGVAATAVLTTPAPFTTLLWRVVVLQEDRYFEGYHSFVAGGPLQLTSHDRGRPLLDALAEHPPVARLRWFTGGFFAARTAGDRVLVADLRMGSEPDYVFSFAVGRRTASGVEPMPAAKEAVEFDTARLAEVWGRLTEPGVGSGR